MQSCQHDYQIYERIQFWISIITRLITSSLSPGLTAVTTVSYFEIKLIITFISRFHVKLLVLYKQETVETKEEENKMYSCVFLKSLRLKLNVGEESESSDTQSFCRTTSQFLLQMKHLTVTTEQIEHIQVQFSEWWRPSEQSVEFLTETFCFSVS